MEAVTDTGCPGRHPVLVVEDDPDIRECERLVLEQEGFDVVTAANGAEAEEELLQMGRPCLVLLDLMMPVMSGWELLDHLRKNGSLKRGLHVVVMSASSTKGLEGAVAVMRKPVRIDKLIEMVHRWC
jgi:CheY-like chemotaxis protein